jgi:Ion channel
VSGRIRHCDKKTGEGILSDNNNDNRRKKIGKAMSLAKALTYFIIAYVIVTFGFGYIYTTFFPDEFLTTSIKSEPNWKYEIAIAESKVINRVQSPLQRASGDFPDLRTPLSAEELQELLNKPLQIRPKLHMMPIEDIHVEEFHVEESNNEPILKINMIFKAGSQSGYYFFGATLIGHYYSAFSPTAKDFEGNIANGLYGGGVMVVQRDGTPWEMDDPIFSSLVPRRVGGNRAVLLNPVETSEIGKLLSKYQGIHNVGGDWKRMTYFSSVVVTTLGLGDIVPLSDLARMIVALEASFGIILFGLFVSVFSGILSQSTVIGKEEYDVIHGITKKAIAEVIAEERKSYNLSNVVTTPPNVPSPPLS